MRNKVFNTKFENMLRVLLLVDTLNIPVNNDRIVALDFMCIYGKKCKVLDINLHGDNEFGFAEFTNKREKINEAIKLSVINNYMNVENTEQGFLYSISDRGKMIVQNIQSPYATTYIAGARIVCEKFSNYTDDDILQYISARATESKGD